MNVTTRVCYCDRRIMDMRSEGTFRYSQKFGGWFFTDAPTRTMSQSAFYYAFFERHEYDHEDHRGEPYVWLDCPYCGNILPGVPPPPLGQGDGSGEGPE